MRIQSLSCTQILSCLGCFGSVAVIILMFFIPFAEAQTQTAALTDISLDVGSDSGIVGDNITDDSTPSIAFGGTIDGATLAVTVTNQSGGDLSYNFPLVGGTKVINFSFGNFSDDTWTFSATQQSTGEDASEPITLTVIIDTAVPTVTVTNPASQTEEATSRTFSAADDESGTTTMKVAVQTESTCAASAPGTAASYTEGSDYVVTGLSNNNKYLCFWSEDVAGNTGRARSNQIQNLILETSATPDTPNLIPAVDSGVNNDNITNNPTPTFTVSGTVNGATVTVTATKGSSTVTGTMTAPTSMITYVTLTTPLFDGIWSVSATQTESGKNVSPSSAALSVTIDTTTPTVTVTNPASQTEEAASRTFSADDNDSETTTMKVAVQTESTCAAFAPESAASYTEGDDYVVTGPDNNNKYLCFWSEDVAGNVGKARSDQIQNLIEISATPGTPDLATGSDSGVDNDNITNNSTPTFTVSGTVNGATITVTATKGLSTVTGDATASGASTNVTLPTLSDGIWSVSATQQSTGEAESVPTAPLAVTIDTTTPTATVTNPASQTEEAISRTFSRG